MDSSSQVDSVMTWYDAIAPSYDELYGDEQLRKYYRIFDALLASGTVPCRRYTVIVDIGCGTSLMAKELGKLLTASRYYYVGIDISLNILEVAKNRIDGLDILADLVAGDADSLPFREGIADMVFSISVFRCEDPVDELVTKSLRLCRDGGVMAFTVVCGEGVKINTCYGNFNPFYKTVVRAGRELIQIIKCEQPKDSVNLRDEQ